MLNRYKKIGYTLTSIGYYPEDDGKEINKNGKLRDVMFERLGSRVADQLFVYFPNRDVEQPLVKDITKKIWKKYGK